MLVHTHTEVDKTGKSYMGETGLYYMTVEEAQKGKGKVQNVTLRKEGPIHDVQWSPLGDEFIVIFGVSPPEACIFNTKCEVTHSFGEAPRNTVSWSPHGRFLALAGFGNMSGELAFYDRKGCTLLGVVDAHMTVSAPKPKRRQAHLEWLVVTVAAPHASPMTEPREAPNF